MTDRELLEFSAKAAGMESLIGFGSDSYAPYWLNDPKQSETRYWNPLTDDGDALRLAVKLKSRMGGLWIYINSTSVGYQNRTGGMVRVHEECGTTPDAATRRAIVRAAAEIGKSMRGIK